MEADLSRVKHIVDAYHEEQPDDRDAWLAARCGEDEALRAEVESLLDADAAGQLSDDDRALERIGIEHTGDGPTLSDLHPDLGAPTGPDETIGPYRLIGEIGVGGTSVVYRAERAGAPFEQTVAVKVLQRRLHADDAERRFRAEQQVLASLDHPNVAQLIDGGVTEGGRPYLVMEYVDGTPLTDYVRANDLSLDARLDLLAQVMEAVRAAHENLVVHRDLKPSNVLVTKTETGPTVKLLDFGIAKLLDDTLPVTRPRTQTGHRLLTPAYAAPEQLTGDADVSTRTDVYQLGALAYEVLAGTPPFDLEEKGLTEIEQIIAEETPPRPSAQATDAGVPSALQGDLDTILRKALRKEPDRRYRSVEAFMEDLRRYRAGEPVRAQPATMGYRARKFLQRNATGVAVAALFVLLAVGFTAFHVHRISEQRDRARREAEKAEQVAAYLTDLLQSTRPAESGGRTVTAEDMLRRGRRRIDRLDGQPAVQARMLQLLGNAYRERGRFTKAAGLLRRSLSIRDSLYGETHRSIANTLEELAHLQKQRGQFDRADSLFRASLSKQRALFGPSSPKLWEPLNNLGDIASRKGHFARADSLFQAALAVQRNRPDPDSSKLLSATVNLATANLRRGRYRRADSLYQEVVALERRRYETPHAGLATTIQNFGLARSKRGRYAEADSLLRKALAMYRAVYDPPHPKIALTLLNRGTVQKERGRYAEADSLVGAALSMLRTLHTPPHPYLAVALNARADVSIHQNEFARADSLLERSLAMKRQIFGPKHQRVGIGLANKAQLLTATGRPNAAVRVYRKARSILRDRLPADHLRVTEVEAGLGRALMELGRPQKARPLLRRSLAVYRELGHEKKAQALRADLADLSTQREQPTEAVPHRRGKDEREAAAPSDRRQP